MLHAETEGLVDVLFPVGEGLARKSEHQVDGDIADARLAQQRRGSSHLSSRMATAKQAQAVVGEGLRPHRDAVDGRLGNPIRKRWGDVVRITLHRHLDRLRPIYLIYIGEETVELIRCELARCATPEIDRRDGLVGGQFLRPQRQFLAEGIDVGIAQRG